MTEFIATSGAKVVINPAGFTEAMALKNAVVKELGSAEINIDLTRIRETNLNSLLPLILQVDSSEQVNAALWVCLGRCLYNSEKISEKTFEAVKARVDYYEIAVACLKENISPFLDGLLSKLISILPANSPSDTQKSE